MQGLRIKSDDLIGVMPLRSVSSFSGSEFNCDCNKISCSILLARGWINSHFKNGRDEIWKVWYRDVALDIVQADLEEDALSAASELADEMNLIYI